MAAELKVRARGLFTLLLGVQPIAAAVVGEEEPGVPDGGGPGT